MNVNIGLVAHVDAGKTTLAESILFHAGAIRAQGRVDRRDSFLDHHELERKRGITIFAKQARCELDGLEVTLLDTPGHVDFSAEMERTLPVLDLAVLVISGTDGVQAHTLTLWKLLARYSVPVFLFVNKMDMPGADQARLMEELKRKLDSGCVMVAGDVRTPGGSIDAGGGGGSGHKAMDKRNRESSAGRGIDAGGVGGAGNSGVGGVGGAGNSGGDGDGDGGEQMRGSCVTGTRQMLEELSMCDEVLLEEYLQTGALTKESVAACVGLRKVFPCAFGSALKGDGIIEFLESLVWVAAGAKRAGEACWVGAPYAKPAPTDGASGADNGRNRTQRDGAGAKKGGEGEAGDGTMAPLLAYVYKISRDDGGTRLTHLKVVQGELQPKMPVFGKDSGGDEWGGKPDQLRLYSGVQYKTAQSVGEGMVCAATGLGKTYAGGVFWGGEVGDSPVERIAPGQGWKPAVEPVLGYRIIWPEGTDKTVMYKNLQLLEEEEPTLQVEWIPGGEIQVRVMGEVQTEVLSRIIAERFGVEVSWGEGSIIYKETITGAVEGVGHFEPLKHYSEVHLLLEGTPGGSGVTVRSVLHVEELDARWQSQILSALRGRVHRGVMVGAPLTDVCITLIGGRGHDKHTSGGDFYQASGRAVRHGLRKAQRNGMCVLLEPYYDFVLEVPGDRLGRALSDLQKMSARFDPPVTDGEWATVSGSAPVSEMRNYQQEVAAYARGMGRLSLNVAGFGPCHNVQEVCERAGYDADADQENPSGAVFCSHGAGFFVPWEEVESHMHVPACYHPKPDGGDGGEAGRGGDVTRGGSKGLAVGEAGRSGNAAWGGSKGRAVGESRYGGTVGGKFGKSKDEERKDIRSERELESIFERTYGPMKDRRGFHRETPGGRHKETSGSAGGARAGRQAPPLREHLLVDGYNMVFAWQELKELAGDNLDAARDRLIDILANYQGYRRHDVTVVFDAYKVPQNPGKAYRVGGVCVVYTKTGETADRYIERAAGEMAKNVRVRVASSDGGEQLSIWGAGAARISAREFEREIEETRREIAEHYSNI
ncbi:MAG: NYN domain-containing protein [Lachnospiraceae bacterium]|jgi:small GTP-binding protein|nr:NYN domain-containing protein [Lachnospiraceae bacterium]